MVSLVAVDPDPSGGTWVAMTLSGDVTVWGLRTPIVDLTSRLGDLLPAVLVVEDMQSYGMPVGRDVFETVKNIGELRGWARRAGVDFDSSMSRPRIKSALCHSPRATDANVSRALYDLYGDGTAASCKGTKDEPGPLYGFKKDLWSALAVGVAWLGSSGRGPLAARDGWG